MTRSRMIGLAAGAALTASIAMGGTALGAQHGLHLTLPSWDFTSGECLEFDADGGCLLASVHADGTVRANVGGVGSYHGDLIVDFSAGGTCNTVDESDRFSFAGGALFVHSHHEDCREHGNRIFTTFTVTGGTGDFAGATGGGLEFGNSGAPITYNGQLDR